MLKHLFSDCLVIGAFILLCQACNSTKGTGTQEQLIEKLKADRILPAV